MSMKDKSMKQGLKIIDANVLELADFGADMAELIISDSNPHVGHTLYDSTVAAHYNASVVALRSHGADNLADVRNCTYPRCCLATLF